MNTYKWSIPMKDARTYGIVTNLDVLHQYVCDIFDAPIQFAMHPSTTYYKVIINTDLNVVNPPEFGTFGKVSFGCIEGNVVLTGLFAPSDANGKPSHDPIKIGTRLKAALDRFGVIPVDICVANPVKINYRKFGQCVFAWEISATFDGKDVQKVIEGFSIWRMKHIGMGRFMM